MPNGIIDISAAYTGKATKVLIRYDSELSAQPLIVPGDQFWKPFACQRANVAKFTRMYIPVHGWTAKDHDGHFTFHGTSSVFIDFERGCKTLSVAEDAQKIAEMDFGAFGMAPKDIATIMGRLPDQRFPQLLNAGYTTPDWTGTNFFRKTATKPVCPGKPSFGKWLNAFENVDFTNADDVQDMIQNIMGRKDFTGYEMGLNPEYIWVPWSRLEEADAFFKRMDLIPSSIGSDSGGGNRNKFFGRLKPIGIRGMRDDIFVIAANAPAEFLQPFWYGYAGSHGSLEVNDDPDSSGSGVPHIEIIMHDKSSEMYKGSGGGPALRLGITEIVNEGYGLFSPHTLCAGFTGSAS